MKKVILMGLAAALALVTVAATSGCRGSKNKTDTKPATAAKG